ncbi:MAG: type II secretion system F family protein [Planctomycetaceae bacterium]|nr:type II secretion system F family protein [Planctomycetaceae bacterium]
MQEFAYTARNMAGQDVSGLITAESRNDVMALLTDKALFPIDVKPSKAPSFGLKFNRPIKTELLASTLTQLSDLLANGVPMLQSLEVLIQQTPNDRLQSVLADVRSRISEGAQLHEAMKAHSDVFNELTISIVRAGAEGAFLEESLQQTAEFLERQEELRAKIRGAMAYPAFLATAGSIVTIVLIVFFVPKFGDLFAQLEREGTLPTATVVLLWLSDFLGKFGILVALALMGVVIAIRKWAATPDGRRKIDRAKTRLPVFGPIFLNGATSRFCRILGTLLRNGVPMLKALEISSDSSGNVVLGSAIRESAENISSGATLSEPLSKCGLIPSNVMAMISIAEEANNLERVLNNIADGIDKKVARQLDTMVRLIEPALLMVMGSAVLFVIVALLLPVFEMSTSMG